MAGLLHRCRVEPLPGHQASFLVDEVERTRWHFGGQYPRPFLYPVVGPSGKGLTRMGHPGAPNHDHHRSVWFANHDVEGMSFWTESTQARILQKQWLVYQDGEKEALMAVGLGWFDGHEPESLVDQELVISVSPFGDDSSESLIELQSRFIVRKGQVEFRKTNFGFLAVRVAASISGVFGAGMLTGSNGKSGEKALFETSQRWMDYSGPVPGGEVEGITYFDHPENRGFPNGWHVRDDGWMGCAPCMKEGLVVKEGAPFVLRHLLHVHAGKVDADRASEVERRFHEVRPWKVEKATRSHRHFEVSRQA